MQTDPHKLSTSPRSRGGDGVRSHSALDCRNCCNNLYTMSESPPAIDPVVDEVSASQSLLMKAYLKYVRQILVARMAKCTYSSGWELMRRRCSKQVRYVTEYLPRKIDLQYLGHFS